MTTTNGSPQTEKSKRFIPILLLTISVIAGAAAPLLFAGALAAFLMMIAYSAFLARDQVNSACANGLVLTVLGLIASGAALRAGISGSRRLQWGTKTRVLAAVSALAMLLIDCMVIQGAATAYLKASTLAYSARTPTPTPISTSTVPHRQLSQAATLNQCLAFSADGKTLASGCGNLELWDIATGQILVQPLPEGTGNQGMALSPDGNTLAFGTYGDDTGLTIWDIPTRQPVLKLLSTVDFTHSVSSLAYSPDGQILAWGTHDGTITLWDVPHHREIISVTAVVPGFEVSTLVFSPDGKTLAYGRFSGSSLGLLDVTTLQAIGELATDNGQAISQVAFSPDGKTLAAGSLHVYLWEVATRRLLNRLNTGCPAAESAVAFSPEAKTLATACAGSITITLWDVASGQPTGESLVEPDAQYSLGVSSLAFSPDGTQLAAGSAGFIDIWELKQ